MALPWPHSTPTLPRPVPAVPRPAPAGRTANLTGVVQGAGAAARRHPALVRLGALATNPVTALVVMLLGLALLFVMPMVGLPFVALVVLPAVIYHLQSERRTTLVRPRR